MMFHIALDDAPAARRRGNQNTTIGGRYLAGAALCLAAAGTMRGPAWILAYPALSLFLVALSCFGGKALLKKRGGGWSAMTAVIFAPYLVGAWCSWRFYMRRIPPWTEIAPGLLLGRRLTASEAQRLPVCGNIAVIDLAPELPECELLATQDYTHVPMLDLVPPTAAQLNQVLRILKFHLDAGKPVFVHCTLGLYRGPIVVAAWLVQNGMRPGEAHAHVHRLRPQVVIDVHDL
ncbi:MAG: dual specificity protein phosphatase family protein [Gammaproteobacteria bacterium]|nr:dual specificity protein phosphatase family protein [Gammaproteobacteria bacterium]